GDLHRAVQRLDLPPHTSRPTPRPERSVTDSDVENPGRNRTSYSSESETCAALANNPISLAFFGDFVTIQARAVILNCDHRISADIGGRNGDQAARILLTSLAQGRRFDA